MNRDLLALVHGLRTTGHTWVQIAEVLREVYKLRPMVAMRLAHGWSQRDAAEEWSRRWPSDLRTFKSLSYWENWPSPSGYEPSLRVLSRLAELYECDIGDLLDIGDFRHLDLCHTEPGREDHFAQLLEGRVRAELAALEETVAANGRLSRQVTELVDACRRRIEKAHSQAVHDTGTPLT